MNMSTANYIMNTIQCRNCFRRGNPAEVGSDFLCRPCHNLAELFPSGESNRHRRGHTFLTSEMLRTIPALYATEDVPCAEKTLYSHYFFQGYDWYIAELDSDTGRAFAYCHGMYNEWGYIDLLVMEHVGGPFSVVERDLDFTPTTARELGSA
jgi:hypothetical protein